jgi:hypothetical protein
MYLTHDGITTKQKQQDTAVVDGASTAPNHQHSQKQQQQQQHAELGSVPFEPLTSM